MNQRASLGTQTGALPFRRNGVCAVLALAALVLVSGCHNDMWIQYKVKPYQQSDFFADQQASRPLVPGTVARTGTLKTTDAVYYRGKGANGRPVRTTPLRAVQAFASPKEMLLRGQQRFNAYCSPCHGKTGSGNGFITQRGLGYWQKLPASFHTQRLRTIEDGHIYDVITNGYGIMYSYAARIPDINDRWAIVNYVRALQLANTATGSVAPTESPETIRSTGQQNPADTDRGAFPGAANLPETEYRPGEPKAPTAGGRTTAPTTSGATETNAPVTPGPAASVTPAPPGPSAEPANPTARTGVELPPKRRPPMPGGANQ